MNNRNLLVVIGVFLIVLCNSIVYGALNTDMFIDGDAYVRVDRNIRVTGIKVIEQVGGAYETYNCDYSKDTTSIQATLPSSDSSIVYEVTITNKSDIDYEVTSIVEESYSNSNIKYEIIDLEKGTVVDGETTYTFKMKLTTTENNSENKGTLVLKYTFEEWIPSLYNMVAHKSKSLDTDIDFGVAPTKETSGVYEMDSTKDDEYPVYYYRGIVENNNVSFAGFCWKAVRTTSTGGVKLIYNGVPASDGSCDNTGEASQIGASIFNTNYSSNDDVSYMYDNGTDSEIKKIIDKWYSDNMLEYTEMLEDTEWCSDRSIYKRSGTSVYYGADERNVYTYNISMTCSNDSDKFTVYSSNGNGKLTYPIALLTADEITLVGNGKWNYNNLGYLNVGTGWWSLSPCNKAGGLATIFSLENVGGLANVGTTAEYGVRPSISLASATMISEGNGSVSKPYKLVEEKIKREWTFDYTGGEQEFQVPYDGVYKLETWGAQGGDTDSKFVGGKGAYSKGIINLSKGNKLYLYVGSTSSTRTGGYNGGGIASEGGDGLYINTGGGGGATDIRLEVNTNKEWNDSNSLKSRIMVASGGGGSCSHTRSGISNAGGIGGSAGGLNSLKTSNQLTINGATQTTAGAVANSSLSGSGSFGIGGNGHNYCGSGCAYTGGGGGGGYYGGGSGFDYSMGGTGGSSYISGYKGCVAITSKDDLTPRKDSEGNQCTDETNDIMCSYHYSGMIFTDTIMKAGNEVMPTKDGLSTMIGNSGNGYAKITLVSK